MNETPLRDGLWNGRDCFIVGGGPSLKGFDWDRLKGELVIGVNRAYEYFDPSIIIGMDWMYFDWLSKGVYGDEPLQKWQRSNATKVLALTGSDTIDKDFRSGMTVLKNLGKSGVSQSIEKGLYCGGNSGFAAINLAICLGCSTIYLLGFDLKGKDGHQSHFHDGHYRLNLAGAPKPGNKVPLTNEHKTIRERIKEGMLKGVIEKKVQPASVYENFLNRIEENAPQVEAMGCKVVNLNPDSALECFEKSTIDKVPRTARPIVVSFYTPAYEAHAHALEKSCRLFGLETDIVAVPQADNWHNTVNLKPKIIKAALERHKRPVLWLDADARIRAYPEYFDGLQADAAFCFVDWDLFPEKRGCRRGEELLAGTCYFRPTRRTYRLIDEWIQELEDSPGIIDQETLQGILTQPPHNYDVSTIPMSYCQIFDHMAALGAPVIEHLQASRKLRAEVSA